MIKRFIKLCIVNLQYLDTKFTVMLSYLLLVKTKTNISKIGLHEEELSSDIIELNYAIYDLIEGTYYKNLLKLSKLHNIKQELKNKK